MLRGHERQGEGGPANIPRKIVRIVRKYEPIGITTMARVKARSLMMTSLAERDGILLAQGLLVYGCCCSSSPSSLFSCFFHRRSFFI